MKTHTTHRLLAAALLPSSTVSQIPVVPTVTCGQCARTIGTGSIQYATGRCVCGVALDRKHTA